MTVQGVTPEMAESLGLKQATGAIVSDVTEGSAAEKAGVKRGDVIQSFNGAAGARHQHAAQPRGGSRAGIDAPTWSSSATAARST